MATFLVTGGRDENGTPMVSTVRADSFSTDESFIIFKTGNVITKAIMKWSVDTVEMVDPPVPKEE